MFWIWLILVLIGSVVGIILLAGIVFYIIGRSMSEEHSHTCAMTLSQPREKVYDLIADVAGWPTWDPGVNRVEGGADADGVFRGRMLMGRNVMGVEVVRGMPPERLEIHVEDLRMKIFSGVWRYQLTPAGAGCRIRLTEDGRIHAPIPRAMARRLADPMMYLKRHLKMVAKKFGEEARIESGPGVA